MKIIYRISDSGYNKIKPEYINNRNCLWNAINVFSNADWHIIVDNTSEETNKMIRQYIDPEVITYVSVGHGAGTFNLALDMALKIKDDNEIVYFLENDYLHKPGSQKIIEEGLALGADFVSLYDHPDKYIDGANPYVQGGGEATRVMLSESCHWKITNSTTMTFATKVKTLRKTENILREFTKGTYPRDFDMFIKLMHGGDFLITPIPSYSTHGETAWLAPLTNWSKI